MLQNPCKIVGFKKIMVYKIIPGGGGGVKHIQTVAYIGLPRGLHLNLVKLGENWEKTLIRQN